MNLHRNQESDVTTEKFNEDTYTKCITGFVFMVFIQKKLKISKQQLKIYKTERSENSKKDISHT